MPALDCRGLASRLWVKELVYAAVIMLGALNFGYNVGFGSPASDFLAREQDCPKFNSSFWFRSIIYLSAVPGALSAPALLNFMGRRSVTFIYSGFGAVFWLLFFLIPDKDGYAFAVVVRTLCGIVIGGFSVVIPMYLVEISPAESTGFYGTLNQVAISFGIVVCYSISFIPDHQLEWMYGIGALICLLSSVLIWFIPESPAITEVNPTMIVGQDNETLWARKWLWPIILVVLMMFFQQMTGINPLLSNIDQIFKNTKNINLRLEFARLLTSIMQVIGNFIGAFFTEVLGRRAIWVISLAGISAMDLTYAIILSANGDDIAALVLVVIFIYLFAFGFGAGPIPWFLPPEVFPVRIRPMAGSLNAVANWLFAFATMQMGAIQMDTPARQHQWDFILFYIFAAASAGGMLVGLFFIKNPEIQAREELHKNIFDDLVSR
jgi:MFS family permease